MAYDGGSDRVDAYLQSLEKDYIVKEFENAAFEKLSIANQPFMELWRTI